MGAQHNITLAVKSTARSSSYFFNAVIAVVLGYIGIQVHKGIQKIATGQF